MYKNYKKLEKFRFLEQNINEEYKKRINNSSSITIDLNIFSEILKKEIPLFYMFLPKHFELQETVYLKSKKIEIIFQKLPELIKLYTLNKLFVNEILYTNEIEGVYSTKKAIYSLMSENENQKVRKKEKLVGITQKYKNILNNKIEKIDKIEDFRKIYDDLFVDFLKEENYKLDGKLFRKKTVNIVNNSMEIVHSGIYGEENIVSELEKWIDFINDKEIPTLIKAAISHFHLEYVHPFYDGNGRFGRYLFSMCLAENIDKYTALSLSYSISKNKSKYYKEFKEVENKYNMGEITFFVENILDIIILGQNSILELLYETVDKIGYMNNVFEEIKKEIKINQNEEKILYILIQDYLFNGFDNITNKELGEILNKSLPTINKYVQELVSKKLLDKISNYPLKYEVSEYIKNKF